MKKAEDSDNWHEKNICLECNFLEPTEKWTLTGVLVLHNTQNLPGHAPKVSHSTNFLQVVSDPISLQLNWLRS